jgi:hypothetical protein
MIIGASEICGIVPRTLVKREMKAQRVFSGCYLTTWMWASTPCWWYALAKFTENNAQSSPQDWMDPGVRFMSQVRAGPVKATWK